MLISSQTRCLAALLAGGLMLGCQREEGLPDLRGIWEYSAEELIGDAYTCEISGTSLDIDDFARLSAPGGGFIAEFTGTFSGGALTCVDGSGSETSIPVEEGDVDGTMENLNLTFDLDSNAWQNAGLLDNDERMTGVVFRRVSIDGTEVQLTGDFQAVLVE